MKIPFEIKKTPMSKSLIPILVFFLSSICSATQPRELSLNLENVTIKEAIKKIEKSSDYVFVFSENIEKKIQRKTNLKVENASIDIILKKLLLNSDLDFKLLDLQIVIFQKDKNPNLQANQIDPPKGDQEVFPVSGTVVDKNGMPITGATLVLKADKKKWTLSDFDGVFHFKDLPKDGILAISSIGYKKREVSINGQHELAIELEQGMESLDEVVITSSYGTTKKRSELVSSTYQVSSEDIKNLPAQRVDQLLDGIVPGLQYSPQSDDASSARPRYSVTIRGEASLAASNEPLWVVDGTPIYTGDKTNLIRGMQTSVSPLSYINPEDIESITVLKDASATSLYGADGANGVILINTKSGRPGKMLLNVSARIGMSKINESTRFKVLNGEDYMALAKESYLNAGKDMAFFPFTDNELNQYSTTNTNWYDVFYDTGSNAQINLSASGGSEKSTYYLSGSYFKSKSTVIGNSQERFTLRTRNNVELSKKLSMDLSLAGSYNINALFTPGHDYYQNLPIISPYNEDGSFRQYYRIIDGRLPNGQPNWVDKKFFNSLAEREQNDNDQRTFAFQGNFKLKYEPIKNIHYTGQFGVDYQGSDENTYSSMKNWSGFNLEGEPVGGARWSSSNFLNWDMIHRINFNKKIQKHSFSGVLGFEMSSRQNRSISAYGSDFLNDHLRAVTYAADQTGTSSSTISRKMSYLGQLSYSYDSRYNVVVNARKDGNSSFGKDVRWANFASLGASWNIHNEAFFESNTINHLSVKASYGSNGNSRIGSQEAQGVYSIGENYNYAGEPGAGMSKGPNPTLSWETTFMTNLGFRLVMLNNRVELVSEVYRNKTENLLSNLDVSRTTGNLRVYRNVGAIENKGLEVTLRTTNIRKADFQWETTILASKNKNKILELYNDIPKNFNNTRWEEGMDVNTYYLVRWAGVDPRDGYPLWYDFNGNITRTYSVLNRVADKNSSPDLYGSITNTFQYKNFSLLIRANYTLGGYAFSTYGRNVSSDGLNIMSENQSVNQLERWQYPGDLALSPKPLWGISTKSVMHSTRYLYKKTNIRLQNVVLNYILNKEEANKLGLKALSLSLIGDNLGVWTPYDKKGKNSYKNNMSGYPMERTVSLGVNISI